MMIIISRGRGWLLPYLNTKGIVRRAVTQSKGECSITCVPWVIKDAPFPSLQYHHSYGFRSCPSTREISSRISIGSSWRRLTRRAGCFQSRVQERLWTECWRPNLSSSTVWHRLCLSYAHILPDQPLLTILVNDVRPPGSTPTTYPIWYEVGFRLLPSKDMPQVHDVQIRVYSDTIVVKDNPAILNAIMFRAVRHPADRCSLVHKERVIRIRISGKFFSEYWHYHHPFTNEGTISSVSIALLLEVTAYHKMSGGAAGLWQCWTMQRKAKQRWLTLPRSPMSESSEITSRYAFVPCQPRVWRLSFTIVLLSLRTTHLR